jgi:molybdenum cofactor guanylyltransferase
MDISGIILCGGLSSRMGEEKGLVSYQGAALIEYSIFVLNKLTDKIFLSTANPAYKKFGYPLIPDIIESIGPIGGIFSCMSTLKVADYFVLSCDIPHVTADLAKKLLSHANTYDVSVPVTEDNKIHPLFGYYSNRILPHIKKQIDNKNFKMIDLLYTVKTNYLSLSQNNPISPDLLRNINSKKDVK